MLTIDNQDKREFYIAETIKNNWTVRQLERQIDSGLFERLLISNDKASVLAIARNEKLPSDAKEIIKDPKYFEVLRLFFSSENLKVLIYSSVIDRLK